MARLTVAVVVARADLLARRQARARGESVNVTRRLRNRARRIAALSHNRGSK